MDGKAKNGKGKKYHSKSETGKESKKHDMSKVKFFHCHDHGHYATNCPQNKKNKKKALRDAVGEALASYFKLDFFLIACMTSNMMGSMWYLYCGAYFHMIGNTKLFSSLEEKDLQMHIEMGDDGRYNTTGIGTVTLLR